MTPKVIGFCLFRVVLTICISKLTGLKNNNVCILPLCFLFFGDNKTQWRVRQRRWPNAKRDWGLCRRSPYSTRRACAENQPSIPTVTDSVTCSSITRAWSPIREVYTHTVHTQRKKGEERGNGTKTNNNPGHRSIHSTGQDSTVQYSRCMRVQAARGRQAGRAERRIDSSFFFFKLKPFVRPTGFDTHIASTALQKQANPRVSLGALEPRDDRPTLDAERARDIQVSLLLCCYVSLLSARSE